ncbi:MAG: hypothetical protein LBB04_02900 [Oscillospiraceae bacterium]|nr:hypothetical protein [Oscillospiraceae bacterium]
MKESVVLVSDEASFRQLLEERTAEASKLLAISTNMQSLLEKSRIEAVYPLLDVVARCFEELRLIDEKLSELSHKSDSRNLGRIKRILAMNEPDNLTPGEQEMVAAMRTFSDIMRKITEKNTIIKEIFLKEQQAALSEIASIRAQKAKLLHSKKFLDPMDLGEPGRWEVES